MFLFTPGFAYAPLAEVSLYRPLEVFFRYGYKNPGMATSGILADKITHARYVSVTTRGKQFLNEGLAAEPFFLLEGI